MEDLLTLTQSTNHEELYTKIKKCSPLSIDTNKYVSWMSSYIRSPMRTSSDKMRIRGSADMKHLAQTSISVSTENKLACTLLDARFQVKAIKFIDTSDNTKDILKTLLEDKDWTGLIVSSSVQNLSKEALKTIEQVADKLTIFDRRCLDVIAVGNNDTYSLAENDQMLSISMSHAFLSYLKPFTAYKTELKEYYYQPKKTTTIEDIKGFNEYIDYHVKREIVGLNYANDRKQIDCLLAAKLNPQYSEYALLLTIDKKGGVTALHTLSEGTVDKTIVSPNKILDLMQSNPDNQYCVLTHNHPSGNAEASPADLRFTEDVDAALEIFDYTLLEHTIVARDNGFCDISYQSQRLEENLAKFNDKFREQEPEIVM